MMELRTHLWGSTLFLLVLLLGFGKIAEGSGAFCAANSEALAALHATDISVQLIEDIGYGFYFVNDKLSPLIGGPNVTRGLVILPEDGISPVSYAPYAREVALFGYYVVIVRMATRGIVLEAMMQKPELEYWSLAGHGRGGEFAAKIAVTLQPKVKSLVLMGAVLPPVVNLRSINLFLTVIYGDNDTVTTAEDVTKSFARVKGDTSVIKLSGFGHYDFAYSLCVGNTKTPSSEGKSSVEDGESSEAISLALVYSAALAQWFPGTKRALSYGDNHYLTPGFDDSKPYPGDIRVRFEELPIPNTYPQRVWWVFTPSRIKGGIVYYPGAAVEGRGYFPLAFQIAARGHLVVIPEQPARNSQASFDDANIIIDSDLTIFSGVPKGRWAIAGHSLGGNAATLYTADFGYKIYGTVLHAGDGQSDEVNLTSSEVPLLQMYGTLDYVVSEYAEGLVNPSKTTSLTVEGANHCQVGDYGHQYPDGIATMTLETQHATFAQHTVDFLDALEAKVYDPEISALSALSIAASFGSGIWNV